MIKPSHCWVWDDNVINEHKKSKITIEVWLAANIFANKRIGLLFETWFLRGNILDPEVNIFDMFIDSMFLLKYVLIYTISCGSIYITLMHLFQHIKMFSIWYIMIHIKFEEKSHYSYIQSIQYHMSQHALGDVISMHCNFWWNIYIFSNGRRGFFC